MFSWLILPKKKKRLIIFYKFKTFKLIISNNYFPPLCSLTGQTSYTCSNVPLETVSKKNNTYVSLTTITLSRRLTMHLNDSSSIDLHLKTLSIPKSKFRKILLENSTIIAHEINKLRQQILEALHIKTQKKSIELILKIATIFINAFSTFLKKYSIFLDNILFLLIAFCWKIRSAWSTSQLYPILRLRNFEKKLKKNNLYSDGGQWKVRKHPGQFL